MHDRTLDLRWRKLRDGGEDCIMTRWAANVTRIEEMSHTIFWSENLKRREHSEELGVHEKRMLGSISGK